jgi:hypothetical protein
MKIIFNYNLPRFLVKESEPRTHGFLKVHGKCHCEAFFAEAIPIYGEEIASTGQGCRSRNDTEQEVATL